MHSSGYRLFSCVLLALALFTFSAYAVEETPSIFTRTDCFGKKIPIVKPTTAATADDDDDGWPGRGGGGGGGDGGGDPGSPVTKIPPGPTLMSDLAANIVGVNTHINYSGSIYDHGYASIIKPRLLELGARYIRDNPGGGVYRDRFIELARSGIRVMLVNSQRAHKDYVKSINGAVPGLRVVDAVEPPNESDNHSLMGDQGDIRQYMIQMWSDYKNDADLRSVVIAGPSFARTNSSAQALAARFPDSENYMDVGNTHNYPGGTYPEGPGGGGWGLTMQEALRRYGSLSGGKGIWATETGYKMSGGVPGHPAVSQRVAAKYFPRLMLMHLKYGVPRVYVYQLINNREDFGLLNNDGSPRLQFTALKNFISLFSDPGAQFPTNELNYTVEGDTQNIVQSVLQKRDGRYYVALWQGVNSNDGDAPRRSLTLKLGEKFTQATVYEPTFSTTPVDTISTAAGVNNIPLSVSDQILVVELRR